MPSVSDSWTVASLASVHPGVAEVLLGRLDRAAPEAAPIDVELQLHGLQRALPGARSGVVTVQRLPNSGERPLAEPQPVLRRRVAIGENVTLRVGGIGANEALIVTVAPKPPAQSPAA